MMIETLEIIPAELEEFGSHLEGEIAPAVFELKENEGKALTGLRYSLNAQQFERELLLQGSISAVFELECVRTVHPFKKTIQIEDLTLSIEVEDDVVNPTDQLREEIMILLPVYPVCDMGDEEMTCKIEEKYLALDKDQNSDLEEKPPQSSDDRWAALDQLDDL